MDVKRGGVTPFIRRDVGTGNTSGTVAKAALPNVLPSPGTATPKPPVVRDSFERVGGNLFASVLSPRASITAADPETAARSRTIEGAAARADMALESFIGQAGALLRRDSASEVGALRERLEQLKAEKQALKSEITKIVAQIQELELEAAQQDEIHEILEDLFGDPSTNPQIVELQKTLGQLKAALGKVDVQIKEIVNQIEALRSAETAETDVSKSVVDPVLQAAEQAASTLQDLRNALLPDP